MLTFKDHIRSLIGPYFSYEPLEYAVDNQGTLNESVRLIFRNLGFVMQFTMESATLILEGDISEAKKSNPIIDIFFDIYEKIMRMEGFVKVKNHVLTTDSVKVTDSETCNSLLLENKYVHLHFKNVTEFASVIEFNRSGKDIKLQFGNFNDGDIIKLNLDTLKTKHNAELLGKVGLAAHIVISETLASPSFSKLKSLINVSETVVNEYL